MSVLIRFRNTPLYMRLDTPLVSIMNRADLTEIPMLLFKGMFSLLHHPRKDMQISPSYCMFPFAFYRQNIEDGMEHQFHKFTEDEIKIYNIKYDYMSIMHYGQYVSTDIHTYIQIDTLYKETVNRIMHKMSALNTISIFII